MGNGELGLKNNWQQFSLLVIINAFVGGMVGLERSILPTIAEVEFGMAAKTAILSFIVVFGITKAGANFFMGKFANRIGRKRLLVLGWLFGLPVPFILMYAPSWNWIVFANVLLGINQGLAWSSTVVMKIDLVGQKDRGLDMGINEFAGNLSVGVVAFLTSWIADNWGLRPYPFYIGIGLAIAGFLGSIFLIRDTKSYLGVEEKESKQLKLKNLFWQTSLLHPNLGSVSQAGLINNLNDGMVWGLLPLFLLSKHFELNEIGIIVGVYPAVWGLCQLFTGKMGDHFCKKDLLFWSMLLQAIALAGILYFDSFGWMVFVATLLGFLTCLFFAFALSISSYFITVQIKKQMNRATHLQCLISSMQNNKKSKI